MGKYEDLDRIQKLKDSGSITEEEFKNEKYKILNATDNNNKKESIYNLSLILGICSLIFGIVPFLGLILSIVSLVICTKATKKLKQKNENEGIVTVGLILSSIGILVAILGTTIGIKMIDTFSSEIGKAKKEVNRNNETSISSKVDEEDNEKLNNILYGSQVQQVGHKDAKSLLDAFIEANNTHNGTGLIEIMDMVAGYIYMEEAEYDIAKFDDNYTKILSNPDEYENITLMKYTLLVQEKGLIEAINNSTGIQEIVENTEIQDISKYLSKMTANIRFYSETEQINETCEIEFLLLHREESYYIVNYYRTYKEYDNLTDTSYENDITSNQTNQQAISTANNANISSEKNIPKKYTDAELSKQIIDSIAIAVGKRYDDGHYYTLYENGRYYEPATSEEYRKLSSKEGYYLYPEGAYKINNIFFTISFNTWIDAKEFEEYKTRKKDYDMDQTTAMGYSVKITNNTTNKTLNVKMTDVAGDMSDVFEEAGESYTITISDKFGNSKTLNFN